MYVFVAETVGECTTISSVSTSYVAVVSTAATFEPWPTSVIAKQPMSLPLMMSGTYAARCLSVPRRETAPPNRPNWTPFLMSSDRSP